MSLSSKTGDGAGGASRSSWDPLYSGPKKKPEKKHTSDNPVWPKEMTDKEIEELLRNGY